MITMIDVPKTNGSKSSDQFKVSVIIAHYNAGSKINKNLEQLSNQTMNPDDFEVIVVDDKSPDGIENLEAFSDKIKNFKILVEPENNGYPSIPRNHGIDASKATFIMIIDQDDYISTDALENMVKIAKDKSDVIIPKYAEGLNLRGSQLPFRKSTIIDASVAIDNVLSTLAPHKMFRRSMLNKNNIRFFHSDYIPLAEDEVFVNRSLACSQRITILADKDYYFWVESEGHLALAKRYQLDEPWKGINVITEILNAIDRSSVYTLNEKRMAQAIYVGRFITRLQGGFFSVLNKMKDENQKNIYIVKLRHLLLKYVQQDNLPNIREFAQYIVIGIRQGLDYKGLLELRTDIFFGTNADNIIEENGNVYRQIVLNTTSVNIPVNFLNRINIRLISFTRTMNNYNFVFNIQSDLLSVDSIPSKLIIKNRNTEKKWEIEESNSSSQKKLFLVNNNDLDRELSTSINATFDFYIEVLGKTYRVGQERNELMIDLQSGKRYNKQFYITKGGYFALQIK